MGKIEKAYEITDAKIRFVSLVDKAANGKAFLVTKADGSKAGFSTFGKIIKADKENHYVTGIVYEPMVEDSQGNYMTKPEIIKAAYWFARNGNQVDLQHSFEPLDNVAVVESWVAKADFSLDGEDVREGTWLMTMEIQDPNIWKAVQSGEISGFSMGGIGNYSEEDTKLTKSTESIRKEDGLTTKDLDRLCEIYEEIGEFLSGFKAPVVEPVAEACRDDEVEKETAPDPEKKPDEQAETTKEPNGQSADNAPQDADSSNQSETNASDEEDEKKNQAEISKQMISEMIRKAVEDAVAPLEQENKELQQQQELKEFIREEVANAIKEYTTPKTGSKQLDPVEKRSTARHHYLEGIL